MTINRAAIFLSLACILTANLSAEPKQYRGVFNGKDVSGILDWIGGDQVQGLVVANDTPDRAISITGKNVVKGSLTITLLEDDKIIGTAQLKKDETAASIIWSGKVAFADGSNGILELQRRR